MHLNHYMLLCFLWPIWHAFPELTLPHINQEKKRKKRNEIVEITQKELTLNNEPDFQTCTWTETDAYKTLPGHIELPQVLILKVNQVNSLNTKFIWNVKEPSGMLKSHLEC